MFGREFVVSLKTIQLGGGCDIYLKENIVNPLGIYNYFKKQSFLKRNVVGGF